MIANDALLYGNTLNSKELSAFHKFSDVNNYEWDQ